MKGLVGFGVSAVALIVAAASQYATVQSLAEIDRRVAQTSAVLEETHAELAALRDVESASRGYAATGDERFIEQVKAGTKDARARLERLRRVTATNPMNCKSSRGWKPTSSACSPRPKRSSMPSATRALPPPAPPSAKASGSSR